MTSHVNKLLKQALVTFTGLKESFPGNLERLKGLLDRTQAGDLGFLGHELLRNESWNRPGKAPVTYVDIYEDDLVTMGIFILSPGMKLPLHDHPQMYGLIKVLAGTVQVSSYTIESYEDKNSIIVNRHAPFIVHQIDNSCMLEPQRCNLHEIESVNGAAAFLDILSPPYETEIPNVGPRKCTYFSPIQQVGVNKLKVKIVDCPEWFWSDTYPYQGPQIIEEELIGTKESEM